MTAGSALECQTLGEMMGFGAKFASGSDRRHCRIFVQPTFSKTQASTFAVMALHCNGHFMVMSRDSAF